jgi:hypothetical protein
MYIYICNSPTLSSLVFTPVVPVPAQNNSDAATSTFPAEASSMDIAMSLEAPSLMSVWMDSSGCDVLDCCRDGGWGEGVPPALPDPDPRVFPPPGNLRAAAGSGCLRCPSGPAPASSIVPPSSAIRALTGSSCSERNLTSRPWIRRTFFSRSMHAWCAFSMSSPKSKSTSLPCEKK